MQQILVTGGAGFIGSHLVDYLVEHTKAKIIILDNLRRGLLERIGEHLKNGRVEFINADIRDRQAVTEAVKKCDVIYHLAAQSNVIDSHQDIEYSFSTNVVGTFNVLQIAQEHNIKRSFLPHLVKYTDSLRKFQLKKVLHFMLKMHMEPVKYLASNIAWFFGIITI